MHNSLTVFALIILGLFLNHLFDFSGAFLNFLLFGIVPFSNTSLSPTMMMALLTLLVLILAMQMFGIRLTITHRGENHLLQSLRSLLSKPEPVSSPKAPISRHVISKF